MKVEHRLGFYDVRFCSLAEAVQTLPAASIVVTDSNVRRIYGSDLRDFPILEVAPGEASKSIESWGRLQSELVRLGATRRNSIVAFGGGVVGDLAGFLAASYMRGVPLIQVPTSLLAQVDSSVGGKVGIDLPEGKNLVGAFYPPTEVLVADEVLDTLPEREMKNGMAEVLKYGFILDSSLIEQIETKAIDREHVVRTCIDLKRKIVEADEYETQGDRAKLNFGHTVGHAIEKLTGYADVLHGEAISVGMVIEATLGERIGYTEKGSAKAVSESLRSQGLPVTSVVLRNVDMLIDTMRRDKKANAGKLAFSLISRIGECALVEDVSEAEVRAVLAEQ